MKYNLTKYNLKYSLKYDFLQKAGDEGPGKRNTSSAVIHHVPMGARETGSWSGTRWAPDVTISYHLFVTFVTRDSVI